MAIADPHGLPVAVGIASASPHETKLVEATLRQRLAPQRPQRMIGDLAYDSDPLDQRLRRRGIRLIAPHKDNRVRAKTQDERELRRYCRRKLRDCLLGCITFVVWSPVGSITTPTSSV